MRPRIGLTLDESSDAVAPRFELKRSYVDAVLQAGGLPVPLPASADPAVVSEYLASVAGVVITGGAFDISPALYGESASQALGLIKRERTDFEWAICEGALEDEKPLLGVCGGMQLLNVVRGGSLYQDVVTDLGVTSHEQPAPKDVPTHDVHIERDSLLAKLIGAQRLRVNTTHHQAVHVPGRGITVSARASDGVVEAIELPAMPFVLGVQWHPETAAAHDSRHGQIYSALIAAARGQR